MASDSSSLRGVWAGIGKAHSGDFFLFGAHDLTCRLYNLGDDDSSVRNATVNLAGYKMGPGLGGSASATLVIAHGFNAPGEIGGVTGGWDFDLAIAAKLSDFLKDIRALGKAVDTVQKYKKLRYITENAVKNRGITRPGIYTFPIPFCGGGIHIWLGYKFGTVELVSAGSGIP